MLLLLVFLGLLGSTIVGLIVWGVRGWIGGGTP